MRSSVFNISEESLKIYVKKLDLGSVILEKNITVNEAIQKKRDEKKERKLRISLRKADKALANLDFDITFHIDEVMPRVTGSHFEGKEDNKMYANKKIISVGMCDYTMKITKKIIKDEMGRKRKNGK